MLSENETLYKLLGIPAWDAYDGTGMCAVTLERFAVPDAWKDRIIPLFDQELYPLDSLGSDNGEHGFETAMVFLEDFPGITLYQGIDSCTKHSDGTVTGPLVELMIPWMLEHKPIVAFRSIDTDTNGMDSVWVQVTDFCTLINSAGNSGYRGYAEAIDDAAWWGIGAANYLNGKWVPTYYTSVSDNVDFSSAGSLFVTTHNGGTAHVTGTSFSGPMFAKMIAKVQQHIKRVIGRVLTSDELYELCKDYAVDISTAGKDSKSGYGMFILPSPEIIDIERYAEMLNSRNIDDLRPDIAANCHKFVELCKGAGYPVLVTGTVRDDEYQALCFYKGTSSSAIPSFHSVKAGLAFDICKNVKGEEYSDNAFWKGVGAIGQKMGFNWGGAWTSFVDKPHFQWSEHGKYTSSMIRAGNYPPAMPLYEEDEDMTQDTFNTLYNGVNPIYATIDDVPAYWQEETRALVTSGKLKGDGTGNLNIRHETLRAVIIGER